MEHTQGPWKAVHRPNVAHPYVIEQDKPHGMVVAELITVSMDTRSEDDANARLIAAAPEMLEALELALGSRCGLAWDDCSHRCRERVQVVLDKAKGQ